MLRTRRTGAVAALVVVAAVTGCSSNDDSGTSSSTSAPAATIRAPREFSGMAWLGSEADDDLEQDLFLVVHDTRDNDEERDLPRVSLVRTPVDTDGIIVDELTDLDFPTVPNDLESVARVPGENLALLAESGTDGEDGDPTIYVATWNDDYDVEIVGSTDWPATPEPLFNVEATAIATVGDTDHFLYAERAEGSSSTSIHMTPLTVGSDGSVSFGETWTSVEFVLPTPPDARPASGLDVSSDGRVVITSAYDPGDLGPFDSSTWIAATVGEGADGEAQLQATLPPVELGLSNGLKLEAVVWDDSDSQLFVGTDDEDYGGILRQLRVPEDTGAG